MDMDGLEERMLALRREIRAASAVNDPVRVRSLRAELRQAERAWEETLDPPPLPRPPVRENVHQVLTFLGVPSATKIIVSVDEAFFGGMLVNTQLSSLRRDEEKSFRSAPNARPYYLCAALTAERLSPARGLLAISTWAAPVRVVGPLSLRTDFLTTAVRIAERVRGLASVGENPVVAFRLLTQLAQNIPGAMDDFGPADPAAVVVAAQAELAVHQEKDLRQRAAAAERAARQLPEVNRLFGAGLKTARIA
ncbi:hypothetical protein Acor_46540 [Acrocarpospora corrugata]|uniref:Uncharacterized protein n=1 Tax=Acrocarpospora corrugata TaxID=35763 RepID=A0A5M3W7U1_9ACTN|nr:hypothetical protein Acor_46540 [Acrocarpospora corrugata]